MLDFPNEKQFDIDDSLDSGGTCICTSTTDPSCRNDPDYLSCVNEVNQDLVTATAAIAALSSFAMGLFANMPIAL